MKLGPLPKQGNRSAEREGRGCEGRALLVNLLNKPGKSPLGNRHRETESKATNA